MKLAVNHNVVNVSEPADKTVLQYLREHGLTGTKEGCASGDCGACTVIVRSRAVDGIRTEIINACIAPVGQLAGCHLVTVEGLAAGDELHPAQAAMVESHGSQCGFCTPGFVMSLAALVETRAGTDRETVLQAISGNLCRCTGYRPIVDAGLAALKAAPVLADDAVFEELDAGTAADLLQPEDEESLRRYMREEPGAPLVAGGTDLMLDVTQRFRSIPRMIDVTRVRELGAVTESATELVIGAAVSYTHLESLLREKSPAMNQLLLRLGSRQIRNRGTIGGNLANGSPIADMPPALIVLDAGIEIVESGGDSRLVAVTDFYRGYRDTVLGPGEYIARIHIPLGAFERFHRFYKSSKRIEDDISSVMGAFSFTGEPGLIETALVAYGGMAATPVRLKRVEEFLVTRGVDSDVIAEAQEMLALEMTPLTDVRASAEYRIAMAQAMLERALRVFAGEPCPVITEVDPGA